MTDFASIYTIKLKIKTLGLILLITISLQSSTFAQGQHWMPIKAPAPIKAPLPIKAPEPVEAPKLIEAPTPVMAPKPVQSIKPIKAPLPVKTKVPIKTPKPTNVPKPVITFIHYDDDPLLDESLMSKKTKMIMKDGEFDSIVVYSDHEGVMINGQEWRVEDIFVYENDKKNKIKAIKKPANSHKKGNSFTFSKENFNINKNILKQGPFDISIKFKPKNNSDTSKSITKDYKITFDIPKPSNSNIITTSNSSTAATSILDRIKNNKVDKTAPTITILRDYYEIYEGDDDLDYANGATAFDDVDGNITIKIEGNWNNKTPGRYALKYVAKDKSGNKSYADFVLHVKKRWK